MNETAPSTPPAPLAADDLSVGQQVAGEVSGTMTLRSDPTPPSPSRRTGRLFGTLRHFLGYPLRDPGRFLAIVALLALIGLGLGVVGRYLWAGHHLRAARVAVERYHHTEAEEHLRVCLRVWPNDPEVLLLAARTARRRGAYPQADRFLEGYRAVRGSDDDFVLEQLLLWAERGQVDAGRDFLRSRVREDHPTAPLIWEALARGFIRSFRLPDAEALTKEWLAKQPDNSEAHFLRGTVLELLERSSDAIDSFRKALELDSQRDDVRLRLALLLTKAGRGTEAQPHLEYLRRKRPDDPILGVSLALCRSQSGDDKQAAELLDGVLARFPASTPALVARGRLALQASQPEQGAAWLRKAVRIDPSDYEAHYHLYQCLKASNQAEEAQAVQVRMTQVDADMRALRDVLLGKETRSPTDPSYYYRIGMIAQRAGNADDAVRWFQKALVIDPEHVPSHKELAAYYQRLGEVTQAAEHRTFVERAGQQEEGSKGAGRKEQPSP
jgi:tetratricopeptide (TPR) repeat protein